LSLSQRFSLQKVAKKKNGGGQDEMPEEKDKAEGEYNPFNASTDDGDASSSSGSSEGLLSPTDKKEYRLGEKDNQGNTSPKRNTSEFHDCVDRLLPIVGKGNGSYDEDEENGSRPRANDDLWWAGLRNPNCCMSSTINPKTGHYFDTAGREWPSLLYAREVRMAAIQKRKDDLFPKGNDKETKNKAEVCTSMEESPKVSQKKKTKVWKHS
jgi:hypothetical protein